jgi:putative peptidoglycan lipid II flippase
MSREFKLLKSSIVFSCMTMVSRVLGFCRDILMAHFFGAGAGYDAFLVAFKIPNMFRRLFAEGAFSQAFVPVISEYKTNKEDQLQDFVNKVAGNLAMVLFIVVILGIIFAPFIVRIFAPGFVADPAKLYLAADLLQITFGYLFFISLTALAGSILNSCGKFAVPAFTPVFLNITMILAVLFLMNSFSQPVYALGVGVILAGIVQLLFQIPFLMRIKLLPKPQISWSDPGVKKLLLLMGPAVLGSSVGQINSMIDTIFASFLASGSISWLYYSDRLVEFPLGIFGIGFATVVLPSLSRQHIRQDQAKFCKTVDWGLRCVLLVSIPATIGLLLLAEPLISTLFGTGKFNDFDMLNSAKSLRAYSFSLIGIMLTKILASAFYARQNIKTPVKVSVNIIFCNIILNYFLMQNFAHAGLAFATSLSSVLNATILLIILCKTKSYVPEPGWAKFFTQLVISNGLMAGVIIFAINNLGDWFIFTNKTQITMLTLLVGAMIAFYMALLYIGGIRLRHFKIS